MQALAERFYTEDEFLELEEQAEIKHEFLDGRIYAMPGGTNAHALLCTNVLMTLGNRLRGKPCRVVGSEQMVKIETASVNTYPDASVYCSSARFEGKGDQKLLDPKVIVEVLSSSTESYDRGDKFEAYKQLASLADYLLISQDRVRVEHFRRQENGWLLQTFHARQAEIVLDSIDCALPLSELYDGIDVREGVSPLRSAFPQDEDQA